MIERVRRRAGAAWAFRTRVEREAVKRFARLAQSVLAMDDESPVIAMLERASADEVRHAAMCAALAEGYGVDPGSDAPDDEIAPSDLGLRERVLYEMTAACCITETESVSTVTALLAEQAEPQVRLVLHEIARDEVLHSRMGWAHLAREAPAGIGFLAEYVPFMLAGTVDPSDLAPAEADVDDDALLRHGVLSRSRKRAIFVGTLETVVFPGFERFGIGTGPARAWLANATAAR